MKLHKKLLLPLLFLTLCFSLLCPKQAAAASKVKLNRTKVTISVGKTTTLKVTGTKRKITWSTSKSSVATVTKKGTVTGKKAGTATITAKYGSSKLKCKVTVRPVLSKTKLNVTMGESTKLTVKGASAKITWSSSKKWIATVNNGTIAAIKPGKTTIKAKTNGVTLSCIVTVLPTTSYVAPSYEKLKEKILASNYTHTDGNKALYIEEILTQKTEIGTTEQLKVGFYAIYENNTGLFRFETELTASGVHVVATLKLNPQTVCRVKQPVSIRCTIDDPQEKVHYQISGTARMNILTYNMDTSSLAFIFDNEKNMSQEETLLAALLPDALTVLHVTATDLLVKEKTNLTLANLGFVSFDNNLRDLDLSDLSFFNLGDF